MRCKQAGEKVLTAQQWPRLKALATQFGGAWVMVLWVKGIHKHRGQRTVLFCLVLLVVLELVSLGQRLCGVMLSVVLSLLTGLCLYS